VLPVYAPANALDAVLAAERRVATGRRRPARQAADAGSGRLLLTHLWPGTDHAAAIGAAGEAYAGQIAVAVPGLSLNIR